MSAHRRPCYEFKSVPVKGRVYRYWYLRVPHGVRWRSVYIGRSKPPEPAQVLAKRFRDSGPQSLNRMLRARRALG